MSRLAIDLFAEDRAHEEFLKALLLRLAKEEHRTAHVQIRCARGGRPAVARELEVYQKAIQRGMLRLPQLLVIGIDANCNNPQQVQQQLARQVIFELEDRVAFACAEPHIERWYMADPESFAQVVGVEPPREKVKCERDRYKKQLVDAIRKGGHVPTLSGIEFARELVAQMDFYRAGKNDPSLKACINACRAAIRQTDETEN